MNPKSAKALAWAAGFFIVPALMILSPTGAFALLVLAACCAAIPALFATGWARLISVALLAASVALAAGFYPAFKQDREAYMNRARQR